MPSPRAPRRCGSRTARGPVQLGRPAKRRTSTRYRCGVSAVHSCAARPPSSTSPSAPAAIGAENAGRRSPSRRRTCATTRRRRRGRRGTRRPRTRRPPGRRRRAGRCARRARTAGRRDGRCRRSSSSRPAARPVHRLVGGVLADRDLERFVAPAAAASSRRSGTGRSRRGAWGPPTRRSPGPWCRSSILRRPGSPGRPTPPAGRRCAGSAPAPPGRASSRRCTCRSRGTPSATASGSSTTRWRCARGHQKSQATGWSLSAPSAGRCRSTSSQTPQKPRHRWPRRRRRW